MAAARWHHDFQNLTCHERAALESVGDGHTREEIADALRLSPCTVGHLLTIAKEKLGARTLTQAAVIVKLEQHVSDLQ